MQETNIISLLDRADAAKELLHAGGNSAIADFMTELTDAMRATWPIARVDGARERTEVVWLNPACSAALERSRGGLFAEHAA